jgi:Uma2 family endonuclease
MPAAAQISVSEYLATPFRPDREYVDGEIVERNVGERTHSDTQGLLYAYFLQRKPQWGTHPLVEQRVQVSTGRFRIPDVCVLAPGAPFEEIVHYPPLLCVEILSKDDVMSQMQEKIEDYLKMGVPHVWVIDPRRRGYHYTADGMREAKDGILRTSEPELTVPLAALFD